MWSTISHQPCFAHSIWEHDEPAGKCGLRRFQQSDWFTATCGLLPPPATGNVPWLPRLRWRGSLWRAEVEVEMEVTSRSLLASLPQSFMPLYLVSPFLYSHPPVLYFKASLVALCSSFIHLTSPTIAANESSYLESAPEETRASFNIPCRRSLRRNSQGNCDKEPGVFHYYYHQLWCFFFFFRERPLKFLLTLSFKAA